MALTEKQKLFCVEYLKSFNATQAYINSYKVSYNTAQSNAYRMMGNDGVIKEIKRLKKEKKQKSLISQEDVFDMMLKQAFSDIGDYVEWYSQKDKVYNQFGKAIKDPDTKEFLLQLKNVIKLKDSKNVDTSLIQEISQGKDGIKIKLKDSNKSLDYLVKFFDMFPDKWKRKVEEEKIKILKENKGVDQTKPNIIINNNIPRKKEG